MKLWRSIGLAMVIVVGLSLNVASSSDDAWLVTKVRMVLLTTEGVSVKDLDVEAGDGAVTLHGKVRTTVEKTKAGYAVSAIKGVKRVSNLMQVLPQAFDGGARIGDDAVRRAVDTALKADHSLGRVTVTSVNNGVVLLGGTAVGVEQTRRAIELVWSVPGVSRVVSRIDSVGRRD
ncbi:MAG: BON domain-containing protein [Vicinamibacteria bacterium]|nr:BON domain-containing protein [Vicinamibacteria bacterium]